MSRPPPSPHPITHPTTQTTSSSAPPVPFTKPSTLTPDYQRDWPAYFDAVADQPPRDTLLRALAVFQSSPPALAPDSPDPLLALDLACGSGRDTHAILAQALPWHVVAVDSSAEGIRRLLAALAPADDPRVRTHVLAMEAVPAALATLRPHLVNASFALPFCTPAGFPALWNWIEHALHPGGRFAGQFFGDRDEWACVRPKSHFTRAQVLTLLSSWTIEHLDEVEKDGSDAMGGTKHHHVFHVVARRPA